MRSNFYQILLIAAGAVLSVLLGVFFYRELFPEYKIYQEDFIALEAFHSKEWKQAAVPFKVGIKQIVIEREDRGPATVDRCISCHVALQIPYFSPTKIAYSSNGQILRKEDGTPILVANEDYIWKRLDEEIASLRDQKVIDALKKEGKEQEVKKRLQQADSYESLKVARVGEADLDVRKALKAHPLIGKETRPFEFHPIEEYGCVSCHSGNGRALTTDKAHGPVFDGQYEAEFLGHEPKFLESDPHNDPLFSKVFNHKPGHKLLFQTTPLLASPLLQSQCLQCHLNSKETIAEAIYATNALSAERKLKKDNGIFANTSTLVEKSEVDKLTQNFERGKDLYFSQACYACHRIASFSRGGVGPELTQIGTSYPWYIKRKLMWPQGDMPASTMPNMRLDHIELQDLMTFLLAQKGSNHAISKTSYRSQLQAWEGGRKMEWEKPVSPEKIYDTRYGMTLFATEGCAACHRLEGFDSSVGFKASEKEGSLFENEQWFRNLFPEVVHYRTYDEELPGSELAERIEKNQDEIDRRIVLDAGKKGLLEEIDEKYPETIESFYSPFRYAERVKDGDYKKAIESATSAEEKNRLEEGWKSWKERVRRVLLAYIKVYGLGRLIGPHLNWSGIYRSDEWLMEHFRNPSSHVPRSIMPIFPFDESKFYALTYMLDALALKNRQSLREEIKAEGFDPKQAYQRLCAQCHGTDLYGNGVIAEWIYPIPKNLHSPEFLRNLTKEKAIESIKNGVQGTPMPPWGQSAAKSFDLHQKSMPVLNIDEIESIVDWLFSTLPGGEVIKDSKDVPKWQYGPEDVVKELEKEGHQLEKNGWSALFNQRGFLKAGFLASASTHSSQLDVDELFDKIKDPKNPERVDYYIKKKYATPSNIEEGKKFFLLNCAACHGNEADGSGSRAFLMQDAKPRMLSNFDWIESRDDLRLLRSIKFGVPGTSMTAWGDQTNALQRIQLVLFIRSLSEEKSRREKLNEVLFQTYEPEKLLLERSRISEASQISRLQAQIKELQDKSGSAEDLQELVKTYEEKLKLSQQSSLLEKKDAAILVLQERLTKEKEAYLTAGTSLIGKSDNPILLSLFLEMVQLNKGRYSLEEGELKAHFNKQTEESIEKILSRLITLLDQESEEKKEELKIESGKIYSPSQKEHLETLEGTIKSIEKTKETLILQTRRAIQLAQEPVEEIK